MSPQLIKKVLNQNWFVSAQMKGMRGSGEMTKQTQTTTTLTNTIKVLLHNIENAAAKFIRAMNHHHKNVLFIGIYCIVLILNCVKYINCDIEPRPMKNQFNDEEIVAGIEHLPKIDDKDSVFSESNGFGVKDIKNNRNDNFFGDVGFIHAFIQALAVIVVSELGDKTFFIAAIMAMRHPRLIVFAGAISALALMTILSAVFGQLANLIPRVYTYYISTALFAIFGLKMIRDGYYMSPNDAQEELDEVQSDLKKREDEFEKDASTSTTLLPDVETGVVVATDDKPEVDVDVNVAAATPTRKQKVKNRKAIIMRILIQAFSMTFLAEWGDRSQLTTIIVAARDNVYGVIVGGVLGHALCTGLAVIGGRMIAQKISVRTVTIVGGIVFICFAFSAFFVHPSEEIETNP